jgi:hypothetical protein
MAVFDGFVYEPNSATMLREALTSALQRRKETIQAANRLLAGSSIN